MCAFPFNRTHLTDFPFNSSSSSTIVSYSLYPNTKCTGSPFGYVNFSPTKCNRLDMGTEPPYYLNYNCPSSTCQALFFLFLLLFIFAMCAWELLLYTLL